MVACDISTNRFRAVGFIAQNMATLKFYFGQQRNRVLGIVVIAGREQKLNRVTQTIYDCMDFCGESPS